MSENMFFLLTRCNAESDMKDEVIQCCVGCAAHLHNSHMP